MFLVCTCTLSINPRVYVLQWDSKDKPVPPARGVVTMEAPAVDPAPRQPVPDENKVSVLGQLVCRVLGSSHFVLKACW